MTAMSGEPDALRRALTKADRALGGAIEMAVALGGSTPYRDDLYARCDEARKAVRLALAVSSPEALAADQSIAGKPTNAELQVIGTYLHPSRGLSDKSAKAIEEVMRAARDELLKRGRST